MRSQWSKTASRDLDCILGYIAQDKPQAARDFLALILKKAEMLEAHPLLGRAGIKPNTRLLVTHENYVLHYRIRDDELHILRLLHAKRMFP